MVHVQLALKVDAGFIFEKNRLNFLGAEQNQKFSLNSLWYKSTMTFLAPNLVRKLQGKLIQKQACKLATKTGTKTVTKTARIFEISLTDFGTDFCTNLFPDFFCSADFGRGFLHEFFPGFFFSIIFPSWGPRKKKILLRADLIPNFLFIHFAFTKNL